MNPVDSENSQGELFEPLDRQGLLRAQFKYEPEKGQLIRRLRCGRMKQAGSKVNTCGHLRTSFQGKPQLNHRIIMELQLGEPLPPGLEVDHINGDPSDNRTENLRLVTHLENSRNQKRHASNKSGVAGVCWNKKAEKWQAGIGKKGINRYEYLGLFTELADAIQVRKDAELRHGYHPNHGRETIQNDPDQDLKK